MASQDNIFGRGIAFPPKVGPDGRVAWSSGQDNVRENIRVILLTELGERRMLPAFGAGLTAFLYEPNTVGTRRLIQERIEVALVRWERRIKLIAVDVDPDPDDERAVIVSVRFELIATRANDHLSLGVQLFG